MTHLKLQKLQKHDSTNQHIAYCQCATE